MEGVYNFLEMIKSHYMNCFFLYCIYLVFHSIYLSFLNYDDNVETQWCSPKIIIILPFSWNEIYFILIFYLFPLWHGMASMIFVTVIFTIITIYSQHHIIIVFPSFQFYRYLHTYFFLFNNVITVMSEHLWENISTSTKFT